jgi:hypothetical protein
LTLPKSMSIGNSFKLSLASRIASITAWPWSSDNPTFINIYAGTSQCEKAKLIGKTSLINSASDGWVIDSITFLPDLNYTHLYFEAISPNTSQGFHQGIGYILIDGLNTNFCETISNLDTDGDGIVNRLDLDSDGDGCSDAFESGATTDKTKDYIFSGPYGANGLDDRLETTNESGVVNYSSTYLTNALDNSIKQCLSLDTDKDGIADEDDIDDDNDGVLDFEEGICLNQYKGFVPSNFEILKYDLGKSHYDIPTNQLPVNKLSLKATYITSTPGLIQWPTTSASNHVSTYIQNNNISYQNGYNSEPNVNITI